MEEQKNRPIPSNFVTIIELKQRWLQEKEERRRELEKPDEQNRDRRQEIQSGEGETSEDVRLMEKLNLRALDSDSRVPDRRQCWKAKHNLFASVKNQGTVEASRGKEEPLVADVKMDGPPDMGSENKVNDLELAVKGEKGRKYGKKKKKKKQTTAVVEKNPKSEGEPILDQNGEVATKHQNCEVATKHNEHLPPTLDQNCEVATKHNEHLPKVNDRKLGRRRRKTDEKKGKEDEYGANSGNVDQNLEIATNDETRTEDNRWARRNNGVRRGYRDGRVNAQKEKRGGALVWVRKGEISSGVSNDFHSQVSGAQEWVNK